MNIPLSDRTVLPSRDSKFWDQFKRNHVLAHWEMVDETVAQTLAFIILEELYAGVTEGEGCLDYVQATVCLPDGTHIVRRKDLWANFSEKESLALWLPYLPNWRMDRVGSNITRFLVELGWDVGKLILSRSGAAEDELMMEWRIRI